MQPEDLPEELRRREGRLAKIRAAIAALEEEAKEARAAQLMEQAEGHRRTAAAHPNPRVRKAAATNAAKRERAARELLDDDSDDEPPPGGGLPPTDNETEWLGPDKLFAPPRVGAIGHALPGTEGGSPPAPRRG